MERRWDDREGIVTGVQTKDEMEDEGGRKGKQAREEGMARWEEGKGKV